MKQFLTASAFLLLSASPVLATTYTIDTAHTEVSFKVKHLGITNVRGVFADFSGTVEFDPKNVKASKTNVLIKSASIDTQNQKRDDHLRSADFLNVEKQPAISFVSKEIKDIDDEGEFTVVGELTINDVTKVVELEVEHTGSVVDPWGNQRAGFEAETTINRKDFGITWNKALETGGFVVGEDVKVEISLEGIKAKETAAK